MYLEVINYVKEKKITRLTFFTLSFFSSIIFSVFQVSFLISVAPNSPDFIIIIFMVINFLISYFILLYSISLLVLIFSLLLKKRVFLEYCHKRKNLKDRLKGDCVDICLLVYESKITAFNYLTKSKDEIEYNSNNFETAVIDILYRISNNSGIKTINYVTDINRPKPMQEVSHQLNKACKNICFFSYQILLSGILFTKPELKQEKIVILSKRDSKYSLSMYYYGLAILEMNFDSTKSTINESLDAFIKRMPSSIPKRIYKSIRKELRTEVYKIFDEFKNKKVVYLLAVNIDSDFNLNNDEINIINRDIDDIDKFYIESIEDFYISRQNKGSE